MLTRRLASDLLERFRDGAPPAPLLELLTFRAAPLPLDGALPVLAALPIQSAHVIAGPGTRRALAVVVPAHVTLRSVIANLAQRLHRHAAHHRWLVVAASADGRHGALAAWQSDGTRARIGALLFSPARLLESDVETLLALHAAAEGDDLVVHARWCEILGREALSHRFYRALEHHVIALGEGALGSAPGEARRELALLTTSRLLFLSFLQTRGWLDGDADFLVRHLDRTFATGGQAHRRLLEPLFFGTLNTRMAQRAGEARAFGRVPFLNGGLFARSPLERRYRGVRFRDEELGALFDDVLTRYRFSPREQQRDWSESAVDPEMLGRAFESLMASRERRDSGSYYTPHALVARATDAALEQLLGAVVAAEDARTALRDPSVLPPAAQGPVRAALASMRLLDPACGSGAFLVHTMERVAALLAALGDRRPPGELRRAVLTQSIFGVDVNPIAAWLCELRLWLSVVMDLDCDDPLAVPPLPNLDRNIRVGDTLAAGALEPRDAGAGDAAIAALRSRYARASGARKVSLARVLDRAERERSGRDVAARLARAVEARRALVQAARGRDLFGHRRGAVGEERLELAVLRARVRQLRQEQRSLARGGALPFRFATHFADVAAHGGFDLVIGNPPWVRLHRIPPERREAFRRDFAVFRQAAWQPGAAAAGAGTGFAAQVDLAALFAERSMELVAPGGTAALLLPLKLWRSLAGGGVRRLLGEEHDLRLVEDWSEAPAAFDAAVYPSLVVVRRRQRARRAECHSAPPADDRSRDIVQLAVHRRDLAIAWSCARARLPFDATPGAPWLLLPPPARDAFARLMRAGPSLAESGLGRPTLGVKCGCNDAFLVECRDEGALHPEVSAAGRRGSIERGLLRPVMRGESARPWTAAATAERIIWTHDAAGRPLQQLPPLAHRWLARSRTALAGRSDLRGRQAWWALHRIDGASSGQARVVWADVSRGPRACVLPARSPVVPLNSCYVVTCRDDVDAAALAALLNSPLAAAWLDALAEPARGGFRRYLAWTVAHLPIPADWDRARALLAPIGQRGVAGESIGSDELLEAVVAAYRVRASLARALVEWTWR